MTGTVKGAAGTAAPTGGLAFFASGNLGTWSAGENLANGSSSFQYPGGEIGSGTVNVTVTYPGDTNYAETSVTVPITITAPFSLSGTPVTIATPGATVGNTSTITISPLGGFTGPVTLGCVLTTSPAGAKNPPGCAITTSQSITGTAAVAATMTVTSVAKGTVTAYPLGGISRRWLAIFSGVVLAGLALQLVLAPRAARKLRFAAASVLLVVFGVTLSACSGGGSGGNGGGGGGGGSSSQTTPGAYAFTVTATTPGPNAGLNTVSATTQVAVTIQ